MRVLTLDTCPVCKGEKKVMHPDWAYYYSQVVSPTPQKAEIWFRSHGIYEKPLEWVNCGTCKGTGEVHIWMDIEDFKKLIEQ